LEPYGTKPIVFLTTNFSARMSAPETTGPPPTGMPPSSYPNNPGTVEDLHKRCQNIFPMFFNKNQI